MSYKSSQHNDVLSRTLSPVLSGVTKYIYIYKKQAIDLCQECGDRDQNESKKMKKARENKLEIKTDPGQY